MHVDTKWQAFDGKVFDRQLDAERYMHAVGLVEWVDVTRFGDAYFTFVAARLVPAHFEMELSVDKTGVIV